MENAPVGTFIAKFQIKFQSSLNADRVPSNLEYSLESKNDENIAHLLNVDQNGVLKTNGMLHKMKGKYTFDVIVQHSEQNSTATVNLEVLSTMNCQPRFLVNQPTVLYLNSTVGF